MLIRWTANASCMEDVDKAKCAMARTSDLIGWDQELMVIIHGRVLNPTESITGRLGEPSDHIH